MKITYTKKIIKNLGNYENVTIEIVVEDEVNDFAAMTLNCTD